MKSNRTGALIAFIVFILCGAYTGLWFYTKDRIAIEVAAFMEQIEEAGLTVDGPTPVIGGFPGKHEISFFGRLSYADTALEIPRVVISGIFLPGNSITIDFENGLALRGDGIDPEVWSLNTLYVEGIVPAILPEDLTVEGMRTWRDAGGRIDFTSFKLSKRDMKVSGTAFVTVDEKLQPAGQLDARMTGNHIDLLMRLQEKGVLDPREALMTGAVFTGLSRRDEKTGESYFDAAFTLQNRHLLLGPLKIAKLPEAVWPWRHPPAPEILNYE